VEVSAVRLMAGRLHLCGVGKRTSVARREALCSGEDEQQWRNFLRRRSQMAFGDALMLCKSN
jgi:hypothetical protein